MAIYTDLSQLLLYRIILTRTAFLVLSLSLSLSVSLSLCLCLSLSLSVSLSLSLSLSLHSHLNSVCELASLLVTKNTINDLPN